MSLNLYGSALAFAIFVGYSLTASRASKRGLSSPLVWDSLPWVLVFGIFGARLYHVINYWNYYSQNPILILQVWLGGLGIFGALIGGFFGLLFFVFVRGNYITLHSVVYFFTGRKRQNVAGSRFGCKVFRSYLDAAAAPIALGQAIGRIGNIFNRENLPFAYWEIITNLLIFMILLIVEKVSKSKAYKSGYLFILYLFSYAVTRFSLEFFRQDSPWILGPLTVAQWISLGILVTVILVIYLPRVMAKNKFA